MAFETYVPGRRRGGILLSQKTIRLSASVARAMGVSPGDRVLVQFDFETRVLRVLRASSGGGLLLSKSYTIAAVGIFRWVGLQERDLGHYEDVVIADGGASIQLRAAMEAQVDCAVSGAEGE